MIEALAQYLEIDRHSAYRIFRLLNERWPQVNDRTRLSETPYTTVHITGLVERELPSPKRLPINGLRKFKRLWTKSAPVPIARRMEYQEQIWTSPVTAIAPYFWRLMGQLTGVRALYLRGTEYSFDDVPMFEINPPKETLHLERLQFQYRPEMWPDEYRTMACAYHAPTDTLYIHKP